MAQLSAVDHLALVNVSMPSLDLLTFDRTEGDRICTPIIGNFLPIVDDRKCTLAFDDLLQLIRYR